MKRALRQDASVLVVEDDMLIALDTEERLRQLGFGTVSAAGNFREASGLIEGGAFDLVLCDLNLDGISSLPLVEQLARNGDSVVVTSGYDSADAALARLGVPVLTKPYSGNDLKAVLDGLGF